MPKVTISSSKGLEQTSGSGFSVSDVELVRSSESITPTSASYTVTCIADDPADSLDDDSFVIYAQDGESYGIWFDVAGTLAGSAPGVSDFELEVAFASGATADAVATAIKTAIDADTGTITSFGNMFTVIRVTNVLTIYVNETGALTTTSVVDSAAGIEVDLAADGSAGDLDEDLECSLVSVGNEVSTLNTTVALASGSSVGQKKNIIFASAANGEVNVGGALSNAGSAAVLLSLTTPGASAAGAACLVWNGSAWVVTNTSNVTVA